MFKTLLLGGAMLIATSENLIYRSQSEATPLTSQLTYTMTVSGPPGLTSQLLASNPALSVHELHTTRTARRVSTTSEGGDHRIEIVVDTARVDGRAGDKPFEFQFDSPTPPADLAADPIRQFAWGLGMAPRRYTVGEKGAYHLTDASQDAQAEAIGVIVDAPVHLPERPVNAGDKWTAEWTGVARKKDGGAFRFHQAAKLDEIVAAGHLAHISFTTSGTMLDPAGKPIQGEETKVETKGTIVLDLNSGTIVAVNSDGALSTEIKTAGLKIAFGYTSKYQMP